MVTIPAKKRERIPLPDDAVVVRGGVLPTEKTIEAAQKCHAQKRIWALSGASRVGEPAEAIAEQSHRIWSYPQMSVGVAGELREAGFPPYFDGPGDHVQIDLPGEPDLGMCETLRKLMPARSNPYYRGRRRSHD